MEQITLLDGGLGQELVKRSGRPPTPLWGTQVMADTPELLEQLHREYFAAGADIATTNTYAIQRDRLVDTALEPEFDRLFQMALDAAKRAREAHGRGRLAGAIGPLRSSYRPDLHPPHDQAVEEYGEMVEKLVPHVDILLAETVASVAHAKAVLDAMHGHGKPVWIAVTVDDEDGSRLRSGEPVTALAGLEADAWLANCSAPEALAATLDGLEQFGVPTGAYANAFERITKEFLVDKPTVDALTARRDLGPERYADYAMGWVEQGAKIVGGCCETGPAHIAEIARRIGREIAA